MISPRGAGDGRGREGMGTTLPPACWKTSACHRAGRRPRAPICCITAKLQQLTRDHSPLAADMIEAGQSTPRKRAIIRKAPVITRALGSDPNTRPDMYEINETGRSPCSYV